VWIGRLRKTRMFLLLFIVIEERTFFVMKFGFGTENITEQRI